MDHNELLGGWHFQLKPKKTRFDSNMETSRELSSEQTDNMFNMFETTKISFTVVPFKSVKANPDIPNKKTTQISEHLWHICYWSSYSGGRYFGSQLPQKVEMWKKTLRSEIWSDEDDEENIHMRYMLWLSWSK